MLTECTDMNILVMHLEPQLLSGQKIWTAGSNHEEINFWRSFDKAILEKKSLNPKKYFSIGRSGDALAQGVPDSATQFERYAAIAEPLTECPAGFEAIKLEGGLYAVFAALSTFQNVQITLNEFLMNWLPPSKYQLDVRAHFKTSVRPYDPTDKDTVVLIHVPILEKNSC